jgi:hypothetical protein
MQSGSRTSASKEQADPDPDPGVRERRSLNQVPPEPSATAELRAKHPAGAPPGRSARSLRLLASLTRTARGRGSASRAADGGDCRPELSAAADFASAWSVWRTANRLRGKVDEVTTDEFYAHDAAYSEDSGLGRELLFLIANHEWVRATSEVIDISRSDVIGTTLKIDIDLRQITHEAFRGRTGRIWLPIAVLPPQPGQRDLELDLFATVTDASGNLLPLLPADELRRQISAALAEIVVNMAAAHMRSSENSRDERVLLSAAIYQLMQDPSRHDDDRKSPEGAGDQGSPDGTAATGEPAEPQAGADHVLRAPRIKAARRALLTLIDPYIGFLYQRALGKSPREQFVPELAHRAIIVLKALADSVIIVVPADYAVEPTVLTVRIPARSLKSAAGPVAVRKPSTWLVGFSGHLAVDLLLPTADANRQIQVGLPDGVSFGQSVSITESGSPLPRLDIAVKRPPAVDEFLASLDPVLSVERPAAGMVLAALADFARAKAARAMQALRYYEQRSPEPGGTGPKAAADPAHSSLADLADSLDSVQTPNQDTLARLRAQRDGAWQGLAGLFRRYSLSQTGPRTILAGVEMIPEVRQRATPERATVHLDVRLDVRDYLSIATRSATMSLILMAGVLAFLLGYAADRPKASPAAEVLAIVLTLFATIQASRISRPDPSTLRGRLSLMGDWLVAGSMLPPVILAVALAFQPHGWAAVSWAAAFTVLQGLALVTMIYGPLAPAGSRRRQWYSRLKIGQPQSFQTARFDYSRLEPLRSDYWRNTTADALMIGRLAHGYVVWQGATASEGTRPLLAPLLRPHRPAAGPGERSSVLALLHSSTQRQAMTFVVFRGQPDSDWARGPNVKATPLELDPDRLAPMDNVTDTADVFIGIHASEMPVLAWHPLLAVIEAARNKLILLEVELPVPAPDSQYRNRQWARVRVAVRDAEDLGRLTGFMETIREQVSESGLTRVAVAVQTEPAAPLRIILDTAGPRSGASEPVLTGDLDVSHVRGLADEPPEAVTWRMVVMCAEARSNIDSDLMRHLVRQLQLLPYGLFRFQLAHLNYARLHGTAVIILLLHDRGEEHGAAESAAGARPAASPVDSRGQDDGPEWGRPQIVVDEPVSLAQLGPLVQYPLLRVRFRWQDRPGAVANVLGSISDALSKENPPIGPENWSVSYARAHVESGRTALGYLTVRIYDPDPSHVGEDWTTKKIERVAWRVSAALAGLGAVAAEGDVVLASDRRELEGPVIRLDLISQSPDR